MKKLENPSDIRRSSAFTLVELLVTITVIGVLVAMVLPSFSKARYVAKVVVCSSQLRQQGIGMNAYASDFKFCFPLFGGVPMLDGYGRTGSSAGWGTFSFDTNVFNTFGTYIGLPNPTAMSSLHKIKYCPVVQWSPYGAYTFIHPGFTPYWTGTPGYSYYTGRSLAGSTWANFNTVNRRNDPKEVLITDQVMQANAVEEDWWPYGYATKVSISQAPWFNPHADRSCLRTQQGSANYLTADGRVVNLDFSVPANNTYVSAWYSIAYFTGVIVGPSTSLTDGPYAAIR